MFSEGYFVILYVTMLAIPDFCLTSFLKKKWETAYTLAFIKQELFLFMCYFMYFLITFLKFILFTISLTAW